MQELFGEILKQIGIIIVPYVVIIVLILITFGILKLISKIRLDEKNVKLIENSISLIEFILQDKLGERAKFVLQVFRKCLEEIKCKDLSTEDLVEEIINALKKEAEIQKVEISEEEYTTIQTVANNIAEMMIEKDKVVMQMLSNKIN